MLFKEMTAQVNLVISTLRLFGNSEKEIRFSPSTLSKEHLKFDEAFDLHFVYKHMGFHSTVATQSWFQNSDLEKVRCILRSVNYFKSALSG